MIISPASFKTWAELAPWVTMHVTQVPTFLVEDQLIVAAREFFRRSCVWRSQVITLLTTVAAQQEYAYSPPSNAELNRVHAAWVAGVEIDLANVSDLAADDSTTTDDTFAVGVRPTNVAFLVPAPVTAGQIVKARVSYKPSSSAVGIPFEAFDAWREAIGAGAAALLMRMADKPWTSPAMAAELDKQFMAGVSDAALRGGRTGGRLKVVVSPC
jgi:hypothetical protein